MSSHPLIEHDLNQRDQDDTTEEGNTYPQRYHLYGNQPALSQTHRLPLLPVLQFSTQVLLSILLIVNLLAIALIPREQETSADNSNAGPNSAAAIFNLTSKVLYTKYGSDVSYMSLDPQFDWLWSSESDKYAGLIVLDPPNDDGSTRWGAITMLHQLHCISTLRTALQRAQRGENIGIDYHDDAHWPHCLHYLRQGIVCNADDMIELPYTWNSTIDETGNMTTKRVGAIDGSGDLRVCRDADELYRIRAERGYRADQDA